MRLFIHQSKAYEKFSRETALVRMIFILNVTLNLQPLQF
jgi:hypothetical protein